MDEFEQVWTSLNKFGQVRTSLNKFGQVWTHLDKSGQVWTSLDKFGQGNKLAKWGKKAEKIRKEIKNLSGN